MTDRSFKIIALLAAVVIVIAANAAYTGWAVATSNRKFCTVVGATVQGYRTSPPTSDVGRTQQRNFEKLYGELGCRK